MSLEIKLERAKKKSGEFVFVGRDPDLTGDHGGTGATRMCAGDDGHDCSLDGGSDFWQETVKQDGQKSVRARFIPVQELRDHCKGSSSCVEKAFLQSDITCTKTVDVAADGTETPHTHTDKCPRTPTVEEELTDGVARIGKLLSAQQGEADLLSTSSKPTKS